MNGTQDRGRFQFGNQPATMAARRTMGTKMGTNKTDPVPGTEPPRDPTCKDFGLSIGRDGTWYYLGSPIARKPLIRLFASVMRRIGDEYWLITPYEQGRIDVADAPFLAETVDYEGEGSGARLIFTTNVGDRVIAGPDHPLRVTIAPDSGEPRPYLLVRDGLEARLTRAVFYELATHAVEAGGRYGVWSDGAFFALE